MRGCKDDDFEVFSQIFKDLPCVWTNIDPRFNYLSGWEFNWQFNIMRGRQTVITVN